MNEVQVSQGRSFYAILCQAYHTNLISKERVQSLQEQCTALLRKRVLEWNHGNSTSLLCVHEQYIRNNMDYILIHGLSDTKKELQNETIATIFHYGLTNLCRDQRQIEYYASFLRKKKVPFPNEYYQSVVYQQISSYIKNLRGKRASFHFNVIQDDLDYPLLDGLPLYHDMYGLGGSDLVLYYTRCLAYEIRSVSPYQQELPQLLRLYDEKTKLSVQETLINICELMIPQLLVHDCLYHTLHVQLTKQDVQRFQSMVRHDREICDQIHTSYERFLFPLPAKVRDYMRQYEQQFLDLLTKNLDHLTSLLVYEEHPIQAYQVFLPQGSDRYQFLHHLTVLTNLTSEDKITYLNENVTSPFDLMDLLDHTLFYSDEYIRYYKTWSISQIAIMLRLLHPEWMIPHRSSSLSSFLQEENAEQEWQTYFYQYVLRLDEPVQTQIVTLMTQISINTDTATP